MKNNTINRAAQELLAAALTERSVKDVELLTINDACKIAKVTRWTVSRWLRLKDAEGNFLIRWSKLGASKNSPVRIDKESFINFLESKIRQAEDGKEVEE